MVVVFFFSRDQPIPFTKAMPCCAIVKFFVSFHFIHQNKSLSTVQHVTSTHRVEDWVSVLIYRFWSTRTVSKWLKCRSRALSELLTIETRRRRSRKADGIVTIYQLSFYVRNIQIVCIHFEGPKIETVYKTCDVIMPSCIYLYSTCAADLHVVAKSPKSNGMLNSGFTFSLSEKPLFSLLSSASLHYTSRRPPPRMFNECFLRTVKIWIRIQWTFALAYIRHVNITVRVCVCAWRVARFSVQKIKRLQCVAMDGILRTCSVHTFSSCCYSSTKSSTWLNFHSLEFSLLTHTNSSLPPQITCLPRFNSFFFSLLLLSFHCFTRKDDGKKKKRC